MQLDYRIVVSNVNILGRQLTQVRRDLADLEERVVEMQQDSSPTDGRHKAGVPSRTAPVQLVQGMFLLLSISLSPINPRNRRAIE